VTDDLAPFNEQVVEPMELPDRNTDMIVDGLTYSQLPAICTTCTCTIWPSRLASIVAGTEGVGYGTTALTSYDVALTLIGTNTQTVRMLIINNLDALFIVIKYIYDR